PWMSWRLAWTRGSLRKVGWPPRRTERRSLRPGRKTPGFRGGQLISSALDDPTDFAGRFGRGARDLDRGPRIARPLRSRVDRRRADHGGRARRSRRPLPLRRPAVAGRDRGREPGDDPLARGR